MTEDIMERDKYFSCVVPVYNEEGNLNELYSRLKKVMDALTDCYEIIFIDDGSTDSSYKLLKGIAQKDDNVDLIKFTRNFGHHIAITAGLDRCKGDYVVLMDADLQDQPEEIPKLYEGISKGYEIAYGVRVDRQDTLAKKMSSALFIKVLRLATRQNIPFNTNTFRIFTKKVVLELRNMKERHRMIHALFSWTGFSSLAVDVKHGKRLAGETKYTLGKSLKLAFDAITSFSYFPLQIATYLGFVIAGMSFLYGLLLIVKWIFWGITVQGFATLSIGMFFLAGIQLIILGLVGEYIGRIYAQAQGRPLYVVDKIYSKNNH
ncbi:MAG: glycosyltransferase family 2 protein [Candidatus Omnitrophota bacterium]